MAERILVSTEEMTNTINRYNSAKETMNNAYSAMANAMEHLSDLWAGPAWVSYFTKWSTIYGNISRTDEAISETIDALQKTIDEMEQAENDNISGINALEAGTKSPVQNFL